MWNDTTRDAKLVAETVSDVDARILLYQARANLELFVHASQLLQQALDKTNFHNFAQHVSGHMTEGLFGADKHFAEMEAWKQRTTGFLLAVLSAGHRFWRCLVGARSRDRGRDWGSLRAELNLLERQYHRARNFMEHLDEAITRGDASAGLDATFSRDGVLTCHEPEEPTFTFDFSADTLASVSASYQKVMEMLEARKTGPPGAAPES